MPRTKRPGDGRGEMEAAGGRSVADPVEAAGVAYLPPATAEVSPPLAPAVHPIAPSGTVAHQPSAERSVAERQAAQVAQIAVAKEERARDGSAGR